MSKTKISITLETSNGESFYLTFDTAKEVHSALHELFGEKTTIGMMRDKFPHDSPYRSEPM